jgi:hypothetical protein
MAHDIAIPTAGTSNNPQQAQQAQQFYVAQVQQLYSPYGDIPQGVPNQGYRPSGASGYAQQQVGELL